MSFISLHADIGEACRASRSNRELLDDGNLHAGIASSACEQDENRRQGHHPSTSIGTQNQS